MNKCINGLLSAVALILGGIIATSHANDLRVPVGAIGYLGEVSPPVRTVYFEQVLNNSDILPNFPFIELITWKWREGPDSAFVYYPQEGAYGISLFNEFDESNRIILLINGVFSTTYARYHIPYDWSSGVRWETASFSLRHSKISSSKGMYHVPYGINYSGYFDFGLEPKSGTPGVLYTTFTHPAKFTGVITSYSAYAPQPLKKGRYLADDTIMMAHRNGYGDGYPKDKSEAVFIGEHQYMGIFVVDTCKVSAITNTKIDFGVQLAGTYPSPKNLANALAQVNVNCPDTGKYLISIKPNNALVDGNYTGMVLDPLDGNSDDLPYIATSIDATAKGDEVCIADSSQAINYTKSKQVYSSVGGNFIQGLNFALCVNGKIAPGKYRGSLDVNFLVE